MTPAEAFLDALHETEGGGSDFRLALESVGGSTRTLAEELGVSQRTVQRWAAYEAGGGAQARNPASSPKAGDLRAMAQVEKEARALDRLERVTEFEADVEIQDTSSDTEEDRNAHTVLAPLDLAPTVALFRQNVPMETVGASYARALGDSYFGQGLSETLPIVDIRSQSLH